MTSIEWMEEQINKKLQLLKSDWYILDKLFEQAKEMHKQEIIDAVNSISVECKHYDEHKWNYENGEQYYQITFKKNKP